ncbi:hypothetical protein [Streptacidiphilus jiangxiensis]|uniref:hypothetical protein n=1 Tax=Streptacidiphilus jiangxiensis TaxID=235985 RepID=UPI00116070A6|nr:hypothetical protein [Streptacidiphilus jiangxiensis]
MSASSASPDSPGPFGPGRETFPLWSLPTHVRVAEQGDGLLVQGRWSTVRLARTTPEVTEALRRMQLGPVLLENVVAAGAAEPALRRALARLRAMVVHSLGQDDLRGPLLSVAPVHRAARFSARQLPQDQPVRLGSSVVIRNNGRGFVMSSPSARHRMLLHLPEPLWVLSLLGGPTPPSRLLAEAPLSPPVTAAILSYVAGAGMVVPER